MSYNLVSIDQQRLADWPVSLDMAKKHLRIDHGDEDDLIQMYIDGAVSYALLYTDNSFALTKYRLYLDEWPICKPAYMLKPPFRAIIGIFYNDSEALEQQLPNEQINVKPFNLLGDVTVSGSLPAVNAGVGQIYIEYVAGYGRYLALDQNGFPYTLPVVFGINWAPQREMPNIDSALVFIDDETGATGSEMQIPAVIKQAILMQVAHNYENREAVSMGAFNPVPLTTEALLDRCRTYGV